jgi:hypothetical protein
MHLVKKFLQSGYEILSLYQDFAGVSMTFNGPPKQEKKATAPEAVQIPEYWQENIPFKSPKKYFELQFAFAKIMAERTGSSLTEAVEKYAPIIRNSTHHLEENRDVGAPIEGVTDENSRN